MAQRKFGCNPDIHTLEQEPTNSEKKKNSCLGYQYCCSFPICTRHRQKRNCKVKDAGINEVITLLFLLYCGVWKTERVLDLTFLNQIEIHDIPKALCIQR